MPVFLSLHGVWYKLPEKRAEKELILLSYVKENGYVIGEQIKNLYSTAQITNNQR